MVQYGETLNESRDQVDDIEFDTAASGAVLDASMFLQLRHLSEGELKQRLKEIQDEETRARIEAVLRTIQRRSPTCPGHDLDDK